MDTPAPTDQPDENTPATSRPHQHPGFELPLAGEISLDPWPNRPGYWANQMAPDGKLREITLSSEEWHNQQGKEMAAMNENVRRLNEHPLNQAALILLRQAGAWPHNPGALKWMHLLSLASLALPDWDSSADGQDLWIRFADWTWSVSSMRAAQARIEDALDPDGVLRISPREVGKDILDILGVIPA